jgi:hyperosmotically inducible protein
MRTGIVNKVLVTAVVFSIGIATAANMPPVNDEALAKKMVHEVRMYPHYSIWDNIDVRVQNGNVDLIGSVSQPFKKDDLGRIAKSIPGVTSVTNDLNVLPLSNMDDRLRRQVARAIYSASPLQRYSIQAVPPIHIIVANGHVTLEGVVATEMEKEMAGIRASGAGLSFGPVTNNLHVENPSPHKS